MNIVSPPESAAPFFSSGSIQIILFTFGFCLTFGFVAISFRIRDRRRQRRGESVPVESRLLRPAGYTVGNQLEDITESLIMATWALGSIGGFLFIAGHLTMPTIRLFLSHLDHLDELLPKYLGSLLWVWPVAAVAFGTGWFVLARKLAGMLQRQADLRLGWRGETAVGEALSHRKVANVALAVFHDVPGDGAWNIDHVVVTRAAVFLIETKTRTKRTGRNSLEADTVECHGETLRFPYWNDEQTVAQAERNARWLRRLVATLVPPSYPIQAVIVLPGWNVRNPERLKIPAMRANDLVQYIAQQAANPSNAPDESSLKPLIKALDERCRTVEF